AFFFQAEDGIRDFHVTGVQSCALPIFGDHILRRLREWGVEQVFGYPGDGINGIIAAFGKADDQPRFVQSRHEEMSAFEAVGYAKIGSASCRESVEVAGVGRASKTNTRA